MINGQRGWWPTDTSESAIAFGQTQQNDWLVFKNQKETVAFVGESL